MATPCKSADRFAGDRRRNVPRPAIYELRDEKTLASVLELAGGLSPPPALRHIEVQRMVAHDKQTMLSVDIPEIENAAEVTKKLESFEIHDGDRIRIFPIVLTTRHDLRGRSCRTAGRSPSVRTCGSTDVLPSYKDLLPEPAGSTAELFALNPPDFHPRWKASIWAMPLQSWSGARPPSHGHGSNLSARF